MPGTLRRSDLYCKWFSSKEDYGHYVGVCGIQLQILGERVCVVHQVTNLVMFDGNVVRKAQGSSSTVNEEIRISKKRTV